MVLDKKRALNSNKLMREEELMRRIGQGDAEAFERLYELYKRPIANLLYRLCFDRALVDDLMQEVFLRVWRGAGSFRGQSRVSTFIFQVAYNVYINESRRRREKLGEDLSRETVRQPADDLIRDELQAKVRQAVQELPEHERAALMLSEYNGLKYQEIAEVLDIPVGTVKSRIFSALQRLRERLRPHVR